MAVLTTVLAATSSTAQREPPPQTAPSDSRIEEIIVRGESEGAEDFVSSDAVTSFNAADIQALGAQSIEDLAAFTPNLEIVTSGSTTPTFFLRGVGLNDFNANAVSSVAIYQDDVNLNGSGLQLQTLFDVENVNVLRGPQGTGLARNSSAGAIKVYARKPRGAFGGYFLGKGGNYDLRDYEGAVETPIFRDMLSARVAFRYLERDGFMRNVCGGLTATTIGTSGLSPGYENVPVAPCRTLYESPPGIPGGFTTEDAFVPPNLPTTVNDLGTWAVRGSVLFEPTLDTSFTAGAQYSERDEFSRLGQSYGTTAGLFGSPDIANYKKPEVGLAQRQRYYVLACQIRPDCNLTGPQRGEIFRAANAQIAEHLARHLDDEPYRGYYDRIGPTQNEVLISYLRSETLLPLGMELRTTSGYAQYDRLIDIDIDFAPKVVASIHTEDELYQLTQDVALSGDLGDLDPATWEAGGFFLYENLNVDLENTLNPATDTFTVSGRHYTQQIRSFGAYAQLSRDFMEDFTLDGGVRWNWENKEMRMKVLTGSIRTPEARAARFANYYRPDETWQDPTGTLRLTYRFREDTHAFWKYTRGWKAGHFNATAPPTKEGISTAKPEKIDAFETGLVGNYFDRRFSLELTFFYYAYTDYQIFTIENNFGTVPAFVVLNAENAEVYGAELDALAKPWQGSNLNVRVSWLESQFLDFVQQQVIQRKVGDTPVTLIREIDSKGNRLLNSPQFKVSISAEQAIPLGNYGALVPRYDGVWTDETFFDSTEGRGVPKTDDTFILPKHTIAQRPYWIHNARISYVPPSRNPIISLWVRNAEDKVYRQLAADAGNFLQSTLHFVGDPRTYGFDVLIYF